MTSNPKARDCRCHNHKIRHTSFLSLLTRSYFRHLSACAQCCRRKDTRTNFSGGAFMFATGNSDGDTYRTVYRTASPRKIKTAHAAEVDGMARFTALYAISRRLSVSSLSPAAVVATSAKRQHFRERKKDKQISASC